MLRALPASLAALCFSLLLGAPGSALGGHPMGTEDAGTLGKGNGEVEFNLERSIGGKEGRQTLVGNSYTLGLLSRLNLAVSLAYLFLDPGNGTPSEQGLADTEVTLKTTFRNPGEANPALGIKAGILLPTGDEEKGLGDGRTRGLLTAIASWEIGRFLIHANLGNETTVRAAGGQGRNTTLKGSLAGEWEFREGWILVGEYLWQKDSGGASPISEVLAGGKVELAEGVVFDLGLRWGLSGEAPDTAGLAGLTLAFEGFRGKPAGAGSPTPESPDEDRD